ncbi:hypothetical protein AUEXF2481DRAFT_474046 [Aureobasidium subglaciale EXF-2481]|uniref:Uncharacterized protein n=1 Tax=Aureobasidium subglaciale (strain EXF-2481) TaxID=1043005 RepID=A0A074ZI40_AURSE|nr:uncharacterized protein AUEXF2481DRAFT_474046 [Aureobasidium subglaciale EXF-2481]KEQ98226.1 hypothetical protein AUEXF2481DRAFT_474046 [Aureobasidium subglaciale EXF-2481]
MDGRSNPALAGNFRQAGTKPRLARTCIRNGHRRSRDELLPPNWTRAYMCNFEGKLASARKCHGWCLQTTRSHSCNARSISASHKHRSRGRSCLLYQGTLSSRLPISYALPLSSLDTKVPLCLSQSVATSAVMTKAVQEIRKTSVGRSTRLLVSKNRANEMASDDLDIEQISMGYDKADCTSAIIMLAANLVSVKWTLDSCLNSTMHY